MKRKSVVLRDLLRKAGGVSIDYRFSKGQTVIIRKRDHAYFNCAADVVGYSYYPTPDFTGTIVLYDLRVTIGYERRLWWRRPIVRYCGMAGEFLVAQS